MFLFNLLLKLKFRLDHTVRSKYKPQLRKGFFNFVYFLLQEQTTFRSLSTTISRALGKNLVVIYLSGFTKVLGKQPKQCHNATRYYLLMKVSLSWLLFVFEATHPYLFVPRREEANLNNAESKAFSRLKDYLRNFADQSCVRSIAKKEYILNKLR